MSKIIFDLTQMTLYSLLLKTEKERIRNAQTK